MHQGRILCQLFMILTFTSLVYTKQVDNRSEDDDIISEAMTKKRDDVEKNSGYISQGNNAGVEVYSQNNIGKADAASIVGDVNKYGLWEYTTDNTEMGEQINSLMKKVQNVDVASEMRSHALEKQANKMNAEINKYAESSPNPSPTVDPLETPDGYSPTAHSISYAGPDMSPIANHDTENNIDVVTIPNDMTIEDEHGNNIDSIKAKPIKSFANVEPTKPVSTKDENHFPSHSIAINQPTSKLLHRRPLSPTTGLTLKLLKALKTSKIFRTNAAKLLASPSDTDNEVFKKQKKLAAFLKAYDKAYSKDTDNNGKSEGSSESVEHMKQHSRNSMQTSPTSNKNDVKLLNVIKSLMKGDNRSSQRDELHDLLAALKSSENKAAKMEAEFTDTPSTSTSEHASMSDPYLQHFKEFVQQHKHSANHRTEEDADHPLGSAASPLMGYLEQETAAVNNIKEPADSPKDDLKKLEQMMIKMKNNDEELRKQHEAEMVDQFKKLLKEGVENKKENEKIAENNGDEGKPIASSDKKEDNFGENVYNVVKNGKEYQNFIASHGTKETKDTTQDEKANSSGNDDGEEFKSIDNQLKEIEMQRELLKIKEEKLKMMNEERQGSVESSSKQNNTKSAQKPKGKEKETVEEKVDHLLHLATPKLKNPEEDSSKEEAVKGKAKQSEPEDGKASKEAPKESAKEEELVEKSDKSAKASHDLQNEEQFKIVDAHDTHENADLHSIVSVENKEEVSNKTSDDSDRPSRNGLLRYQKESEKLGLPITNPSPKDDNSMEPHPHFHHTFHSFDGSGHSPSKAPLNFISPIHSPLKEAMDTKREHRKSRGPTILDSIDQMPPAGMGKPTVQDGSNAHHVYPIQEPSPLVSYHNDSDHHAVLTDDKTNDGVPNTMSNLLKHKTIPSTIAEIDIQADSNDLNVTPYARIIKPKSSKLIDVVATKKGFGKRPKKPKSYLLKELRQKLRMLALKRHLTNQFLKQWKRMNGSGNENSTFHNASFKRLSLPMYRKHKHHIKNSSILVPVSTSNKIITINHTNTSLSDSNVIIPGSVNRKVQSKVNLFESSYEGVNPADITRSVMPKVKNTTTHHRSIEDVFNILSSEDQISKRAIISNQARGKR